MTDKEVGELWKIAYKAEPLGRVTWQEYVLSIIARLVKERAWQRERQGCRALHLDPIREALRDFGIPLEQWREYESS